MFETLNRERLLHNILAYKSSGKTLSVKEGNARESVFAGFGLNEYNALGGKKIEYGQVDPISSGSVFARYSSETFSGRRSQDWRTSLLQNQQP